MVREIFAQDFELFGYSDDLADVSAAPGELITSDGLVPAGTGTGDLPERPRLTTPGHRLETTLRYRRLIDCASSDTAETDRHGVGSLRGGLTGPRLEKGLARPDSGQNTDG